jgi:uncharacterized protein YdhG (YjbR/CyaY superfamily)
MADDGEQAVTAYIKAAPGAVQPMLRQLRSAIKSAVPQAQERISYQMPFYAYHGRLIYFAAHSSHVGMYPIIGREKQLYARELKPYLAEKATLQFPIDKPLPIELIKKVVKERAKQNEEQEAAKRPKKTAPASARKSRSR